MCFNTGVWMCLLAKYSGDDETQVPLGVRRSFALRTIFVFFITGVAS